MATNIIGRIREQQELDEMLASHFPEFLAIYGRRRVGKTFLIKEFCNDRCKYFFNVTGIKNGTLLDQTNRFIIQIGQVFYNGATLKASRNWFDIFDLLRKAIDDHVNKKEKIILFIDELPWLVTPRSRFLAALEYFWNQYWSSDSRIKLIICGSSASWIIKKIINNKGGLHNRLTRRIRLHPFTLKETKEFLFSRSVKLNNQQILQIYLVTGGIPFYLGNIKKGLTATQNIDLIAFKRDSILLKEFDNLFSSLFKNSASYIEIIRIIAKHRYGLAQERLLEQSLLSRGGRAIERLEDLTEAGFIEKFIPYGHQQRGIYYRVIDEYCLFYLRWIEPVASTLKKHDFDDGYWDQISSSAAWNSWSGYAFEALCYKHIAQIRKKLNVRSTAIPSSWAYKALNDENERGAQIDLLFDRDDDAITICEIKYSDDVFTIDKQYAKNLQNKIDTFVKITGTKKQIFVTIISANGLKQNMYAEDLISSVVTADDMFE